MSQVALIPASPVLPGVIPLNDSPEVARPDTWGTILGQAAIAPPRSEFVACLHMQQGVIVGTFALDLPKLRTLLLDVAAEAMRQGGLTMQDVAQQSVRATGALVAQSVYSASTLVQQAAWSTGEACVGGAWAMGTWPMRTMLRAVSCGKKV